MSDQLTVAEYYENVLPQQFAAALADLAPDKAAQPEITSTYAISGDGGGTYGLRVVGGQLAVVPGGIANSDLHTTAVIDDWRRGVASIEEPLIGYVRRSRVNAAKKLRGRLHFEISRADGTSYASTTVYGGETAPEVTVRMSAADYAALMDGTLNSQMAFMTGKLKFDGSLPFLMQLATASF